MAFLVNLGHLLTAVCYRRYKLVSVLETRFMFGTCEQMVRHVRLWLTDIAGIEEVAAEALGSGRAGAIAVHCTSANSLFSRAVKEATSR